MAISAKNIPIQTLHLFPILDELLIKLLRSLEPHEWELATIAKLWSVKDIASHLLDGNLRTLSASRDQHFVQSIQPLRSYNELVTYLNELNADWVKATKRLSPEVLIALLQTSGKNYIEHLNTLNPFDKAVFSVAWAGQKESENWFHIAREYTEKFIHQQQIRDALNRPGILTKQLFYPFISTLMYAFPYTYRDVKAPEGIIVQIKITGEAGGEWYIEKLRDEWQFNTKTQLIPDSAIIIDSQTAWKLFSRGISPEKGIEAVRIEGNKDLGRIALQMVAFMV